MWIVFSYVARKTQQQTEKDVKTILDSWVRSSSIEIGWIDDFNKFVARYVKIVKKLFQHPTTEQFGYGMQHQEMKIQFSPNGRVIVSCSSDKTIRLWDVISGQELKKLKGHSGDVNDVQFSSDAQKIVSASYDKTIGKMLQTLIGHSDVVMIAQFSSDDQSIVSCSWDDIIRIWS
ncbi:hypothetical protein RFI_03572, partial [Reticulomyxa filosa]